MGLVKNMDKCNALLMLVGILLRRFINPSHVGFVNHFWHTIVAGYLLNTWVLAIISTLYLALSLILQSYVLGVVKLSIHKAEIANTFVMPIL